MMDMIDDIKAIICIAMGNTIFEVAFTKIVNTGSTTTDVRITVASISRAVDSVPIKIGAIINAVIIMVAVSVEPVG